MPSLVSNQDLPNLLFTTQMTIHEYQIALHDTNYHQHHIAFRPTKCRQSKMESSNRLVQTPLNLHRFSLKKNAYQDHCETTQELL
jgi:hypothetical protein